MHDIAALAPEPFGGAVDKLAAPGQHGAAEAADALRAHPVIRVNPATPAANMLHLHLPVSRERLLAIRTELAERHGIWLCNRVSNGVLPDTSYFELYVGDNLLDMPDDRLREALAVFAGALGA